MIKTITYILKTIALVAIVFSCTNTAETTQESEKAELTILQEEIEQLIATEICNENANCDFIAFGSKPCGGPWSYLVYSTSINIDLLKEKVDTYNKNETAYNIKWSIVSDCMASVPPTSVQCINGECIAIY
ncbi:hypothetical protein [Lutibacter sp.]|uniref:hypothetical protein n=1 Tax=Lutibacter sp. TaxID=1925666 RepID=UPI003569E71F